MFLPENDMNNNISSYLFQIMIEEKSTNNYKDNKNIKYIIQKLENKEENEIISNKLNIILLYYFINLPLQLCYFSKNIDIRNIFLNEAYEHMKSFPNNMIFKNINKEMNNFPNNSIYMVLGANQENEFNRITSKNPEIPYINLCNTGLRTQYLKGELESFLFDNINNYYINPKYKNIIIQCSGNEIMNDKTYSNFINDCSKLLNYPTFENAAITFSNYNFSVETANTVINYIKLNVSLNDIIIIRLAENNIYNKNLKYNKSKVYILFNVIDVSEVIYYNNKIIRATTESNVKSIFYLKNEYKNFLNKEDYNNLVLVSNQLQAERQLEVFNIISNIFKFGYEFNYVIWNKKYEIELTDKKISNYFVEIVVKSFNLISNSLKVTKIKEYINNNNEELLKMNNFIEEMIEITEKIK